LLLAVLFVSACKDDGATNPPSRFTLSGQVFNTTQRGAHNASVNLLRQGETTPSFNTTTNDTGFYTLSNISDGANK